MNDSMRAGMAVVVLSCDRYADLWRPFFELFFRHWPDCPFPVCLGTNEAVFEAPRVVCVPGGRERSWADTCRRILTAVDKERVLVLLEDFLFEERVSTPEMVRLVDAAEALSAGYLRLKPFPPPDTEVGGFANLGAIAREAPYRAALQAAIWRTDTLQSLLVEDENPWQFEARSSWRSNALSEGFYSVRQPALSYTAGVTFGRWTRRGLAVCSRQGVHVDTHRRPAMPWRDEGKLRLRWALSAATGAVPWRWRRRAGDLLRSHGLLPWPEYRALLGDNYGMPNRTRP